MEYFCSLCEHPLKGPNRVYCSDCLSREGRDFITKYRRLVITTKEKGFPFCMSFYEFKALKHLDSPCHYCGLPPTGLDRIDSSQGYLVENVVPCCYRCNLMKSDLTQADFIAHVRRIIANS